MPPARITSVIPRAPTTRMVLVTKTSRRFSTVAKFGTASANTATIRNVKKARPASRRRARKRRAAETMEVLDNRWRATSASDCWLSGRDSRRSSSSETVAPSNSLTRRPSRITPIRCARAKSSGISELTRITLTPRRARSRMMS